jgi:hypothetical protein
MSIDVKITDFSSEVLSAMKDQAEKGLEEIGIVAEGYAAAALESDPRRIDTGLLRNSITHAMAGEAPAKSTYSSDDGTKSGSYSGTAPGSGLSVYIGTNVDYAGYVHDGTKKMAPNRFLAAAANGHNETYKQIMKRALSGE